jgi:hypothetical protein
MTHGLLALAVAQAKTDDLRRDAVPRRHKGQPPPIAAAADTGAVTLRFGVVDDDDALARLAAMDSSRPPAQPVLLAEVAGELRAGLSLSDGTVVADPFHPTAALVELLQARARQLTRSGPRRARLLSWLRSGESAIPRSLPARGRG